MIKKLKQQKQRKQALKHYLEQMKSINQMFLESVHDYTIHNDLKQLEQELQETKDLMDSYFGDVFDEKQLKEFEKINPVNILDKGHKATFYCFKHKQNSNNVNDHKQCIIEMEVK